MKIKIIAVGKSKGAEREIIERYLSRTAWPVEVIEIEDRGSFKGEERKSRECKLIKRALGENAYLIALSEDGKSLTSREFAKTIDRLQQDAHKELAFLIGGADGLAAELLEGAALQMSLGRMTLPHMLARVLLVEQIYRARSILAGHPYHRD